MGESEETKEPGDDFAKSLFGMTVSEAIKNDTCVECHQRAWENCYSNAGRREFYISGLCEKCFDKICGE